MIGVMEENNKGASRNYVCTSPMYFGSRFADVRFPSGDFNKFLEWIG